MSTTTASTPPSISLNREQFTKTLSLCALRIPAKACSEYLKRFPTLLLDRPRFKRIYDDTSSTDGKSKLLILHESIHSVDELKERLSKELLDFHLSLCHSTETESEKDVLSLTCVAFPLTLKYEHFSTDEILTTLLGAHLKEIPSAFEQAGHIAHMNLRDDALPFKHLIGQVVLDKNPNIHTVVNKLGNIETEFRTFPLEVIAGEKDFIVSLRESGALFKFDFSAVYWNSRLQHEHLRLIQSIRDDALCGTSEEQKSPLVVADLMAGVGPFAVPLAMTNLPSFQRETEIQKEKEQKKIQKKKSDSVAATAVEETASTQKRRIIQVFANDLNPASYQYLVQNMQNNNCTKFLFPHNQDGREFYINLLEQKGILPHHIIMNLPQNAIDFLDVFIGAAQRYTRFLSSLPEKKDGTEFRLPRIHVYAFSTHEDPISDVIRRCAENMRCSFEEVRESGFCEGHIVRDVAPKKVMVCLSFALPLNVALAEPLTEFGEFCFMKKRALQKKRSADEMLSESG